MKTFHAHRGRQGWAGAVILSGLLLLIYGTYACSVIPPQTGWLQEIALRLVSGERIYSDFYWYTPPLFPWATATLYGIFENNMIFYTMIGLLANRVLPAVIMYQIIRPAVGLGRGMLIVMAGSLLASTYPAEQLYDLNPLLLAISIIQAAVLLWAWKAESSTSARIGLTAFGVFSGLQVMFKQTGLSSVVAGLIILICMSKLHSFKHDQANKSTRLVLLSYVIGLSAVIVPVGVALLWQGSLSDFIYCMGQAADAKGVSGSAVHNLLHGIISLPDLLIVSAVILIARGGLETRGGDGGKCSMTIIAGAIVLAGAFCLTWVTLPLMQGALAFLDGKGGIWIPMAALGTSLALALLALGIMRSKERVFAAAVFLTALTCILMPLVGASKLQRALEITGYLQTKQHLLLLFFYLFMGFWILDVRDIVSRRSQVTGLFLTSSVYLGFFSGTLLSATVQELYMMPMFSLLAARLIACGPMTLSSYPRDFKAMGAALGYVCVFGMAVLSLAVKLCVPYSWHAWVADPAPNTREVGAEPFGGALSGYKLSGVQREQYESMYNAIEVFAGDDDEMVQFPSVPLFGVLTGHTSGRFLSIPYFDVAPDALATSFAQDLREDNPEFFVMGDIGEADWDLLENVYRAGARSGQRDVQDFYNKVVKKRYQRLCEIENGDSPYTISLWMKVLLSSPTGNGFHRSLERGSIVEEFGAPRDGMSPNVLGVEVRTLDVGEGRQMRASICDGEDKVWSGIVDIPDAPGGAFVRFDTPGLRLEGSRDYRLRLELVGESDRSSVEVCGWNKDPRAIPGKDEAQGICWFLD